MIYNTMAYSMIWLLLSPFAEWIAYRFIYEKPFTLPFICDHCHKNIPYYDSIPILSYIVLKGVSQCCKKRIFLSHPLFDILGMILFAISFHFGKEWIMIALLSYMSFWIIVIIISDYYDYLVPDTAQIALLLGAIFYYFYIGNDNISNALGRLCFMIIICYIMIAIVKYGFKKEEPLGFADVKLFMISSIYLELDYMVLLLFSSGMLGIASYIIWKSAGKGDEYPFAPAIVVSLFYILILQTFPSSFYCFYLF